VIYYRPIKTQELCITQARHFYSCRIAKNRKMVEFDNTKTVNIAIENVL
jgi:hypothetical protein